VLSREGFVKAVSDIMKHLSPSDAGAIYDKLAKEAGATGAVNYKVGKHISLSMLTTDALDGRDTYIRC
jgi:hypothetical protein